MTKLRFRHTFSSSAEWLLLWFLWHLLMAVVEMEGKPRTLGDEGGEPGQPLRVYFPSCSFCGATSRQLAAALETPRQA
jgi:hypothetical protein